MELKGNPKYNIVSVRISDQEKEVLDQISRRTLKTISDIMREAMQMATPELVGLHEQDRPAQPYLDSQAERAVA